VPYPAIVVFRIVAVAVVLAALATGGTLHAAPQVDAANARLTLDGVTIRTELAMTPSERSVGLMNRTKAPRDGMLFVFRYPTSGGFWMKNTLVPLKIVFFDSAGKQVRTLHMTPCKKDPCRIYDPAKQYRFALELPASDQRQALRLGPPSGLRRLVAASS
jgi:uncharacterized membrane protein (UPF0127 family)